MKLVCLNAGGWVKAPQNVEKSDGPKKGDIVTRVGEVIANGAIYFVLKEWPDYPGGYISTCFMPINETSEKEELKRVEFTEIEKTIPSSAN